MNPKSGVNVSHSDSSGRADTSTFIADLPALASSSGAVYNCPNMRHLRHGIAATTVSLRRSGSSKTSCSVTNSTQRRCHQQTICRTHRKSTTGVSVETGRSLPVAVSVRAMGGMVRPLKPGAENDTSTGTSTGPAAVQRHGERFTGVAQAPAALLFVKSMHAPPNAGILVCMLHAQAGAAQPCRRCACSPATLGVNSTLKLQLLYPWTRPLMP